MGCILMQPCDDAETTTATELLEKTGECKLDLSKNGSRLKPMAFGSRSYGDNETNFHSFTGEGACGRWAIEKYRKYLWGKHFF